MLGGLASSIVSGVQARKAANAARSEYAEKRGLLDNTFNRQYWSDITKRSDIQNMMRLLNENHERQAKRDDAVAAVTGATPEATLAAQGNRNKSYADAMAEIASNASTLKDTYMHNYLTNRLGMTNPEAAIRTNNANQWSQTGNNLFGVGMNMFSKSNFGNNSQGPDGSEVEPPKSSQQPWYENVFNPKPL